MSSRNKPVKYRLKSDNIEAMKVTEYDLQSVARWCGGEVFENPQRRQGATDDCLYVPTMQGTLTAEIGTYVIRDGNGRFGVMSAEKLEARYEKVNLDVEALSTVIYNNSRPPNLGSYGKPNLGELS